MTRPHRPSAAARRLQQRWRAFRITDVSWWACWLRYGPYIANNERRRRQWYGR